MSLAGVMKLYRKALSLFHRWTVKGLDCFAIGRYALHYFGPWPLPEEKPGKLTKAWRTFLAYNSLGHAMYHTTVGFPIMAYMSIGNDFPVTIESLASEFISVLGTSVQYGIILRSDHLERVILAMEATRDCCMKMSLRPESVLNRLQSTILARLLIVLLVVSPSVLLTLPKAIQERVLLNQVWYPFDAFAYPIYPVLLLATSLAHVVSLVVLGVYLIILAAMLAEVAGHFRLLSYNLRNLRANDKENVLLGVEESERAREELKMCVQYHHSIIRFVEEIKSTYNADLFFVGLSVLVPNGLGIALVAFSEEIDAKMVTFVIIIILGNAIVLELFWAAQDVIDESEDIGQAVYDADWIDQSESFKRSMRIIMSRCNQPVVFKAGGFIKFSMETYYDLIKLTYSYCMTLWTSLATKS